MGNKDSKPEPPRQQHHHHHHNTPEQQQHQQFEARLLEAEINVWHSRYPTLAREVVRNVLVAHPLPPQRTSTLDRFVQQQQLHTAQGNAVATTATTTTNTLTRTTTTTTTPQQSQDQMIVTWMHLFPQLDPDLVRRAVLSAQHEGQIFEVLTRATQRADLEHWKSMFPDMPDEIILSVLMSTSNRGGGRGERVLERLLAISSGEVALSAAGVDENANNNTSPGFRNGGRSRDRGSRSARQVPNNSFAAAASGNNNNNNNNSPSPSSQPQYSQERFLYVPDQQDMDLEKMLIAQEEHRKTKGPTPPPEFVRSQRKKDKKLLSKKKDRESHSKSLTEQKKHEKKAEKKAEHNHGGIVLRKIDPLDSSSSSSSSSSSNSSSASSDDDDDNDSSSSNSSSENNGNNKNGSFMITPDKRVNKYLDENHITTVHGLKVGHFEVDDFHKRFPLVSKNTVARVLSCYKTAADRERVLFPGATNLKSTPPLHPSTYQKMGVHLPGNNTSPSTSSAQKNSSHHQHHRNDDDDDDDGEHFDLGPSHNNNNSVPNQSFAQGSTNQNTNPPPQLFKDPSQGTVVVLDENNKSTSPGKKSIEVENNSFHQASPEVKPQSEKKKDDGNDDDRDAEIEHPGGMKKHPVHHNSNNNSNEASSHQHNHSHHHHHKSRSRSNSALTPETECCVCLSNRITQMLVPCCHKISCAACAPLLVKKPCPICRTEVEGSFTFLENNNEE